MSREVLQAPLRNANVKAILRAIRGGESSQGDEAYRMRYGGYYGGRFQPPVMFDDLSKHPQVYEPTKDGRKSSAAGAYQATFTSWSEELRIYGWPDFSPECQDEFAVARILRRGALADVMAGRFDEACRKLHNEWTSLPGGKEENAQTKRARDTFLKYGGQLEPAFNPDSLETEHYGDPPMALPIIPLLTAFGPELVKLIPQFATMFGSGSEVQVRNAKAAEAAVSAVVEAVKAPNLQAAIETMQRDPEAAKAGQIAAADVLSLIEAGGGGIEGARKANAAPEVPLLADRAFIVGLVLMAAVFMLLADVFYVHPGNYDSNIRTQIVTAVLGFAGIVGAYFLGSSFGSQRKTNIIANKE